MTEREIQNFECIAVVPCGPCRPAAAVEAARAGAVAVLDLAHSVVESAEYWDPLDQVTWIADRLPSSGGIGLRVMPDRIGDWLPCLGDFRGLNWTFILTDVPKVGDIDRSLLPEGSRIFVEVRSAEAHEQLTTIGVRVDGIIACGNESAGLIENDSTLILLQKLMRRAKLPVYARGGIGVHSAAACRAAGVRGVVLDDQLLLIPGSPLPDSWKRCLLGMTDNETAVLGEDAGQPCRIFDSPALPAVAALRRLSGELGARGAAAEWRKVIRDSVGWGPPERFCWPVGQSIMVGKSFARHFNNASQIVRHILEHSARAVLDAAELRPLAPNAPLAVFHGTSFPIVQGPMTRVSDQPAFAAAVAEAGALPMIALSMLRGSDARVILEQTRDLLGDRPWGVGILGFVPPKLREEQAQEIARVKPPFALIAGGRADLALSLEREGVETYLHTPMPSLLRHFLAGGVRRFVFEGRECGGHVGPLCSFPMWDSMVETLLDAIPHGDEEKVHVLFAGGIHDGLSAGMVSALAAPLVRRGVRIGVLMGTAYLFTEEAVTSSAITASYQQRALDCRSTVLLTSSVGHSNRVAATAFADAFEARRRELRESGLSADGIRSDLDRMMLGGLRLASKGLARNERGELTTATDALQSARGVYMMGAAAALRHERCRMSDLHRDVSESSAALLVEAARSLQGSRSDSDTIAIIGMATLLPGAQSAADFWRNMLDCKKAIRDFPPDRWDISHIFDANRNARNKTYAKVGGFIDEVAFDPLQYRIPPGAIRSISTTQLLALEGTRRALADAGYLEKEFDRSNVAVIFGTAGGGSLLSEQLNTVAVMAEGAGNGAGTSPFLPDWTSESFPGILANVVAGRVANYFDLGGPNYTVDSACASSLLAVELAARELETGRSDMVICGGIDTTQTPASYIGFSKTQALSPTGQARVFDKSADGIVISEGVSILVMKRLDVAKRDGDRVYAVIRGTGSSSDGAGMGITVPKGDGQRLAIERALRRANITANTIGLYEAHGTGTPLGDKTELENWQRLLSRAETFTHSCAVGSAKALIGHTKCAAGATGLAKAALALYHHAIPPHGDVSDPLDCLASPSASIYTSADPRPWMKREHPRRASVSAFGFGGANTHVVLEEFQERSDVVLGADQWPCELFLFGASDLDGLIARMHAVRTALKQGSRPPMRELAFALAREFEQGPAATRSAVVAADSETLLRRLSEAIDSANKGGVAPTIAIGTTNATQSGAVAFLFPGQGSQYPKMGLEPALYLGTVREALERANAEFGRDGGGVLSEFIFPPTTFGREAVERQRQALADTRLAQPAIGAISAGLLALLEDVGVEPAMAAGHSYGELVALHAAGAFSRATLYQISRLRGQVMGACAVGGMLSVAAPADVVASLVADSDDLVVANHNAPRQTVVSGTDAAIELFRTKVAGLKLQTTRLPVGSAFHSPLLADALVPWAVCVAKLDLRALRFPVYANLDGKPYPAAAAAREQLKQHLLRPVHFVAQIEAMYNAGARIFVEVGPGSVLTRLVAEILADKPHQCIALDSQRGRLEGLICGLAALAASGVLLRPTRLFAGRGIEPVSTDKLLERSRPTAPPAHGWWVNGAKARPMKEMQPAAVAAVPATKVSEAKMPARSFAAPAELPAFVARAGDTRAEIFAAYAAYQETMRRFLSLEEQALATFLDLYRTPSAASEGATPQAVHSERVPSPQAPDIEPKPIIAPAEPGPVLEAAHEAPPASPIRSRAGLARDLQNIVGNCTGYPAEMLGLDADLEADLGIDSLRRIQIVESLLAQLSGIRASAVDVRKEALLQARTLNEIVAVVLSESAAETQQAKTSGNGASTSNNEASVSGNGASPSGNGTSIRGASDSGSGTSTNGATISGNGLFEAASAGTCPRFIPEGHLRRLAPGPQIRAQGTVLISEDELGVAQIARDLLQKRGIPVTVVPRSILRDGDRIADFLSGRTEGTWAIVHLATLVGADAQSYPEWRAAAQTQAKSLFEILRRWGHRVTAAGSPGCRVIGATNMGGHFGRSRDATVMSPLSGAIIGLLKTIALEWPATAVKALDFEAKAVPAEIAEAVVVELLSEQDDGAEIGFANGARTVFTAASRPHSDSTGDRAAIRPQSDWVLLATGGGRGITAEIVLRLVRPGMTVIVAGASPADEQTQEFEDVDPSAIRDRLIATARQSGKTVLPAAIETKFRSIMAARERRRTLQRLSAAGARAFYRQCDIRQEDDVDSLLLWINSTFGRLDTVIHGAGVIEDKLIVQKTRDSFDRVFDTKVDGAFLLSRRIDPRSLKLFVLFGSVSGRFGNAGQADYAAANEVLNRLAWRLSFEWPQTRVMCLNWGPWASPGMATDAVRAKLAQRGIRPIEVEAGCSFFAKELELGGHYDVEVIAGLGPWQEPDDGMNGGAETPIGAALAAGHQVM